MKTLSSSLRLRFHLKTFHKPATKNVFNCDLCNKTFTKKRNLTDHIEKTHNRRKTETHFQCDICDKTSNNKNRLQEHVENVHEKNDHIKCELCKEEFTCNDYLMKHLKVIHTYQNDFKCEYCGNSFNLKASLKTHIKLMHRNNLIENSEKKIIKVEDFIKNHVCTRSVIREPDFKTGIDLFSIKRRWLCVCDFCGTPFTSNGILKAKEN